MNISEFKYLLWDNARKMNDAVNSNLNTCASMYGLSGMQLRILMEVEQNGPHTIGSLANHVLIAGANISSMCKKLEGMELVTRIRGQEDERVVKIELTPKGKRIMSEVGDYFEKKITMAMGGELSDGLDAIIAAMERANELLAGMNRQDKGASIQNREFMEILNQEEEY